MSLPGQPTGEVAPLTYISPPAARNPVPLEQLRQDRYDTDTAVEVFENLLLYATQTDLPKPPAQHSLVIVQAAKGLVGLRRSTPSELLINYALEKCSHCTYDPAKRELLKVDNDKLGLTVSVFDLQDALRQGSIGDATEELMRLLMVSDNHNFLFDIQLEFVCSYDSCMVLMPIVHYAQRAVDFVGAGSMADFLLAANGLAVEAGKGASITKYDSAPIEPWDSIELLEDASLQLLAMVAHATQIEADEHVKKRAILMRVAKILGEHLAGSKPFKTTGGNAPGGVAPLLENASNGNLAEAGVSGEVLGQAGAREWLLESLEALGSEVLTDELLIWADSFRMLYRTAQPEKFRLLGQLAGRHLTRLLSGDKIHTLGSTGGGRD
jgi:hypothetical protein